MGFMFYDASAFNQNINAWNVVNVGTNHASFDTGSGLLANASYSPWYVPPISLDATNSVTIKYTGASAAVSDSAPTFVYANPRGGTGKEWFAVVNNSANAKAMISNYAANLSSGAGVTYFTNGANGLVSFNNIVTTLMTNMIDLFNSKYSFNQPVSSWDTSNVTNIGGMFSDAREFNQTIGNWNTSKVATMHNTFYGANAFNQPIGLWNISNVTNMNDMFYNATAFNQPIGTWNTINVMTMYTMFYSARAFNQPIDTWNTINVLDMANMFYNATAFNQNISNWNVVKVGANHNDFDTGSGLIANPSYSPWYVPVLSLDATNGVTIKYTGASAAVSDSAPTFVYANPRGTGSEWFAVVNNSANAKAMIRDYAANLSSGAGVTYFTHGTNGLVSFNNIVTTLVTDMYCMFYTTTFNQSISSWDTSNVATMESMFQSASAFNQSISNWNTSKVTNMNYMFYVAGVFNQHIGNWNTANVTTMEGMFSQATVFNQPIGTWNTAKVINMNKMFYHAGAFNQDINAWNITLVTPKPPTDFRTGANSFISANMPYDLR
jgi:surface protein